MEIIHTAIRTKKINQFKEYILKTINNSVVGDIKYKPYNKKKTLKKIVNQILK